MLEQLLALSTERGDAAIDLVISDIEMPRPDGYALTRAIREAPALRRLKVMPHSSFSGGFNEALVRKVKTNCFVAKLQPDVFAQAVLDLLAVDAVRALAP